LRDGQRHRAVKIVAFAHKERPASPPPVNLIRVPSSTPAGILASTERCRRRRPSPLHLGQGSVITLPDP
jgi:hypothetical protein